jgi:hypothetical protein
MQNPTIELIKQIGMEIIDFDLLAEVGKVSIKIDTESCHDLIIGVNALLYAYQQYQASIEGMTIEKGIIKDPGKFEGEPACTPYYWSLFMDGFGDEEPDGTVKFDIEPIDCMLFEEVRGLDAVYLQQSNDGFITLLYEPDTLMKGGD